MSSKSMATPDASVLNTVSDDYEGRRLVKGIRWWDGFILLRRDQPNAIRPIRLGPVWVAIAGILAVVNGVFILIGSWAPGYGGFGSLAIGILLLLLAMAFYLFRIYVQDREPVTGVAKVS